MCLQDIGIGRVTKMETKQLTGTIGLPVVIPARADRIAVGVVDNAGTWKVLQFKPPGAAAFVDMNYFDGSSLSNALRPYLMVDFPAIVQGDLVTKDLYNGTAWTLMEWVVPYEITIAAGKSVGI